MESQKGSRLQFNIMELLVAVTAIAGSLALGRVTETVSAWMAGTILVIVGWSAWRIRRFSRLAIDDLRPGAIVVIAIGLALIVGALASAPWDGSNG